MSRETRFRKKPIKVDAMRVREIIHLGIEHGPGGMPEWLVQAIATDPETDEGYGGVSRLRIGPAGAEVRTKQGQWVTAGPDEWILCAAPDDLWPVDPDIFEASYEAVTPMSKAPTGTEETPCKRCSGSGRYPGEAGGSWACPDCNGTGKKPAPTEGEEPERCTCGVNSPSPWHHSRDCPLRPKRRDASPECEGDGEVITNQLSSEPTEYGPCPVYRMNAIDAQRAAGVRPPAPPSSNQGEGQ